ncbi:MAG: TadE/TadG family type IV pilus assembly protein [Amphiplicatus sp.]
MIRRALSDRRGAAALEFAIVCPLIFASVLGALESGRALYESNRLNAASAAGLRALEIAGPGNDSAIVNAVEARFSAPERDRLDVAVTDQTVDGVSFKKIELTYEFKFLINFGPHADGLTFTATRFAPAIAIPT